MNETASLNLQQQLESLSLILEHWLPVLEQMELIEKNIEDLPYELETIRQGILSYNKSKEKSDDHSWLSSVAFQQSANKEKILYLKLQQILESLDDEIPNLLFLEEKIKNIVCLREVTEALQEHIHNKSTTNYLPDFPVRENIQLIREPNNKPKGIWQSIGSFWQNLINPKRFNKQMKFVWFFGLILIWNIASNFIYAHVVDNSNNLDTQVTNMGHRLENIQIHNFSGFTNE
ncbi:MAG: hypothetical protein QNJ34_25495 [Xenococcaceae cyanobacterium MO_188.B29]|nr:hypothetical protein [Xenococcaceae cyanobacterium MO_188.B29]